MGKQYCLSCDGTGKWHMLNGEILDCSCCGGTGIDTNSQLEIICPYCAEVLSTDDRYQSATIDCDKCYKEIELEVDYTPSYSTYKKVGK